MGFIYKILDLIKNKIVYVGQHNNNNKYYEGSGKILTRYKKKYGTKKYRERFKLIKIEFCSLELLDEKEIYWIKYYNTYNDGLNLTEGGSVNISKNNIKGKSFPQKNKKLKGQKKSIETKRLISESMKGKPVSNLCLEKSKKARMKPVLQYDLEGNFIKEWECGKKACISLGFNNVDGISACCIGKQKTAFGFVWKFKKDNIKNTITLEKRKTYKKGVKRIKSQSIEINNIKYNSITQAAKSLGLTFGSLNYKIKNNKIEYKWIKK
jgi:hypothetical protein